MTDEVPSDDRARERVGRVLAEKWTLERLLGEGGMGAVYLGRHRNGARGAVKLLHPELARMPEIRERFLREGYAANRVGHPGAVQVLDDDVVKEGPDAGACYLVMELLEGESLEERLTRPIAEREVLEILDQLLEVLEAAHGNGVVHRDLKPANVFLAKDRDGDTRVKILDFGLARLDEVRSVTRAGLALGTPSFMSPEQAQGNTGQIDGRTDLFALGATAFMIVAGRGVHEAEGVLELVSKMGTVPAPKLRDVAPQASEAIAKVIDGAVAFRKEDRYADATAMRADVQTALAALAGADVAPSGPVLAPIGADPAFRETRAEGKRAKTPPSPPPPSKPRRRSRTGIVVLTLGALGVAGALATRQGNAVAVAEELIGQAMLPAQDEAAARDVQHAESTLAVPAEPVDLATDASIADASIVDADADAEASELDAASLDAASAEDDEEDEDEDAGFAEHAGVDDAGPLPLAAAPRAHPKAPVRKPGAKKTKKPWTPPRSGAPRRKKR